MVAVSDGEEVEAVGRWSDWSGQCVSRSGCRLWSEGQAPWKGM